MDEKIEIDDLQPMSQNAFAKFAGVSGKQASMWKKKGYLEFTDTGLVNSKASTLTLLERGLGKFENLAEGNATPLNPEDDKNSATQVTDEEIVEEVIQKISSVFDSFGLGAFLSYAEATRVEKNYYALKARLSYELAAGKLVDASESEVRFSKILSDIRQSWENWPSSVVGDMAQELNINQRKLRIVLEKYVRAQIKSYIESLKEEDDEEIEDDEGED